MLALSYPARLWGLKSCCSDNSCLCTGHFKICEEGLNGGFQHEAPLFRPKAFLWVRIPAGVGEPPPILSSEKLNSVPSGPRELVLQTEHL